jgi:hypothetical protein
MFQGKSESVIPDVRPQDMDLEVLENIDDKRTVLYAL